MTKENIKRFHLIYGIVSSVLIVIAGICLMGACLEIYSAGGSEPYSREAVAKAFKPIAVPVYLAFASIVGGFILKFLLPLEATKPKAVNMEESTLLKLREKLDLSLCEASARNAILKEQKLRKLHFGIALGLLVLGSAVFLAFGIIYVDKLHINDAIIKSMIAMCACLIIPTAYLIFAAYFKKASIKRELALVKTAIAGGAKKSAEEATDKAASKNTTLIIQIALVVIGVVILVYGLFAGGTADVLTKAINICTECVGLG